MADPMSDERLAEIDAALDKAGDVVTEMDDYGLKANTRWIEPLVFGLLGAKELRAEVERLRAELAAIRTTETDVTWLADGVRRLILGVSVRTAKSASAAQYTIAQEAASHINAGILTAFVSSRIVDLSVDYVRQAEAERDRLAEQVQHVRDRHRPKAIQTADDLTGDTTDITVCQECDGLREQLNDDAPPVLHPCATIRDLGGTEAGPRQVALEQLAERYSEAFECLLYRNEQQREDR